jgi:hypothetical protein
MQIKKSRMTAAGLIQVFKLDFMDHWPAFPCDIHPIIAWQETDPVQAFA